VNLRHPTGRERLLLVILAATVFLSFLYGLVFSSLFERWSSLDDSISITEGQLRRNLAIIHRKDIVEHDFKNLIAQTAGSSHSQSEPGDWLEEIERVTGNRVWLKNLSPRPDRSMGSFVIQTTELECGGTLLGLAEFLYELLRSPLLMSVDQMRLSIISSGSGELKCHLVISRITAP